MAAASYSSDVLQRYYGRIDEAIQSLPRPLAPRPVPRFDGFQDWLRVWAMAFSETNPNRRDIFSFAVHAKTRRRLMVKNSYGIILIRLGARGPETLLVKGRYSYEFSAFVLGHYLPKNKRELLELFPNHLKKFSLV